MKPLLALTVSAAAFITGCGYHVAGRADTLPNTVRTIAIPPFANSTVSYRLTERLPAAIGREFLTRTRYRVSSTEDHADAVLTGNVVSVIAFPTLFDPASGRASGVQMQVLLSVTLKERASGKVIFTRPALDFRQRYEISIDQRAFFDESSAAFERLNQDVARTVVSAVLENF